MALVATPAATSNMYLSQRPGIGSTPPSAVYDGLVSDIAAGDWLPGSRQLVVTAGAASGTPSVRTFTLRRANAPDATVTWLAASAIRIAR